MGFVKISADLCSKFRVLAGKKKGGFGPRVVLGSEAELERTGLGTSDLNLNHEEHEGHEGGDLER